jgi:hypothetical protein
MKIQVIITLWQGLISDVQAFANKETAKVEYKRLCREYNYDPQAEYNAIEGEVYQYEAWLK